MEYASQVATIPPLPVANSFPTAGSIGSGHSNLYVRNIPLDFDDNALQQVFQQFGYIESCRVVKHPQTNQSKGYGFVKFQTIEQAQSATSGLNGVNLNGNVLEVKFADSDAGPPTAESGQLPSDNVYVRNLPTNWTQADLEALFLSYGTVRECRLLHSGDMSRGAGGLIRLGSVEEAARAVAGLSNRVPPGGTQPLMVKYADTAEEKARKMAKKERNSNRYNPYQVPNRGPQNAPAIVGPPPTALPAGFTAYTASGVPENSYNPQQHYDPGFQGPQPMPYAAPPPTDPYGMPQNGGLMIFPSQPQPLNGASTAGLPSSLYVKNLPEDADKLFLYERFAPYGAILSVKILGDDASGKCRGVGFVNYVEHQCAMRAISVLNGLQIGEKQLHVSLQTHRTRTA